jgi:hypothetical protein
MLVDRGITHVLVSVGEIQRLSRSGFLDPLLDPAKNPALVEWFKTMPMIKDWPSGQMIADIRESIPGAPSGVAPAASPAPPPVSGGAPDPPATSSTP